MAKESKKQSEGKEMQSEVIRPSRSLSPFEEMDRLMESFFPRQWLRPFRWEMPSWSELGAPLEIRTPRVDVIDRENDIVVKAEEIAGKASR